MSILEALLYVYFSINIGFLIEAIADGVFERIIEGGKIEKASKATIGLAIIWQAAEIIFLALPEFIVSTIKHIL